MELIEVTKEGTNEGVVSETMYVNVSTIEQIKKGVGGYGTILILSSGKMLNITESMDDLLEMPFSRIYSRKLFDKLTKEVNQKEAELNILKHSRK